MLTDDGHGEFGYLTTAQWETFQWAVSYSFALVPFLRSAGNYSISVDEGRSAKTEPALGMPATQIAAIEIERLATRLGEWDNLEDIANDIEGWQIALDFTREVRTAAERWPMEDEPHDVPDLRCIHCGKLGIVYRPPVAPGDDTKVTCEECGGEEDAESFAARVNMIRLEMEQVRRAR
ncbi:hypothetical protein GCM10010910_01210 [Microbacterium nanhaiense]|uniref:Uncharacterized protein n=1 Tax=Microbacterium nanhaiense TaxID=1301026 RepID=A0ABQ2MVH5_9MICO|nr:hypothetical protein [Microbacterium nanhaiense]GGO59089.1 hypothetical protein GCM10010910_01210 [Microbacterium nanhaiense]